MSTIKFTNQELRNMREFYEDELARLESRVQQLKSILRKFNGETEVAINNEVSVAKAKRGRPKKELQTQTVPSLIVKAKGKQGRAKKDSTPIQPAIAVNNNDEEQRRKSKWTSFILDTLNTSNDFMSTAAIVDSAINKFKVTGKKAVTLKNTIQSTLFRLKKENQIQVVKIPGQRAAAWGALNLNPQSSKSLTANKKAQSEATVVKGKRGRKPKPTDDAEATKAIEPAKEKQVKVSKAPKVAKFPKAPQAAKAPKQIKETKPKNETATKSAKWPEFISSTLNSAERFFTTDEIITMALKSFKLSKEEKDKAKNTIQATLSRLSKDNAIQAYKKQGVRMAFWGKNNLQANEKTLFIKE